MELDEKNTFKGTDIYDSVELVGLIEVNGGRKG